MSEHESHDSIGSVSTPGTPHASVDGALQERLRATLTACGIADVAHVEPTMSLRPAQQPSSPHAIDDGSDEGSTCIGSSMPLENNSISPDSIGTTPPPRDEPSPPNNTRFRIIRKLSHGGMGEVYLAEQCSLGREVAVKVAKDCAPKDAFLAEAFVSAALEHPGIVPTYDLESTGGHCALAMRVVRGTTWKTLLHPKTSDDQERSASYDRGRHLRVLIHVSNAIAFAHSRGIVHLDLKPENVMIGAFGEVFVLDWGLAASTTDTARTTPWARSLQPWESNIFGTPAYIAPEVVLGRGSDIGTATDVYLLGGILHEILTGNPPHSGSRTIDILRDAEESAPPTFDEGVPREIGAICAQALARSINDRFSSAEAFRDALEAFLTHRESIAISTHAAATLARAMGHAADARALFDEHERTTLYTDFASAIAGFENALVLWKDNGEAERGVRTARFAFAKAALALGDLGLAETHVALLPRDDANAGKIRESIAAAKEAIEHAARQTRRMRRALTATASTLAVALTGGAIAINAARVRSETQLAEILRLADVKTARDLEDRAAALWPIKPESTIALAAWLDDAHRLVANAPLHRATLATIGSDTAPSVWQRDVLTELTLRIERLTAPDGTIADIASRLTFARTVHARTIDDHRAAWEHSIAGISATPIYSGLVIAPQVGLVPLGKDKHSVLFEFGHLESGTIPTRNEHGRLTITDDAGIVFILIPGGTFMMGAESPTDDQPDGSPNTDPTASDDESPVHAVTLAPFFLSKYEMTQGQWLRVMKENPSEFTPGTTPGGQMITLAHPVTHVMHPMALAAVARLGLLLPTEAQWEYAARAGTTTRWWTGDDPHTLAGAANLQDAYLKTHGGDETWEYLEWLDDGFAVYAPVGSFRANPFGLHDTIGNVHEWCDDVYSLYENPTDPVTGKRPGHSDLVIARGGNWGDLLQETRVSYRLAIAPGRASGAIGLRPARAVDP